MINTFIEIEFHSIIDIHLFFINVHTHVIWCIRLIEFFFSPSFNVNGERNSWLFGDLIWPILMYFRLNCSKPISYFMYCFSWNSLVTASLNDLAVSRCLVNVCHNVTFNVRGHNPNSKEGKKKKEEKYKVAMHVQWQKTMVQSSGTWSFATE